MSGDLYNCSVCGEKFGVTPGVQRWLSGGRTLGELPELCWVCRRLKASAAAEARGLAEEMRAVLS